MGLAADIVVWLNDITVTNDTDFPPTHYQHLPTQTPTRFAWFMISDSSVSGESLGGEPPDTFSIDLEVYTETTIDLENIANALRELNDYDGDFGSGTVQNVEISNQSDDYVPLVDRDDLPAYFSTYRLTLTGYEES